ncbi:lytic transglycosylase domain-containing protein [Nocardioides caeni]|uniref:Lytic transglycosylase domain-containing protein n=1 Tax=Nocardioides caeni TaxID=574700 RepID=A0A4S8NH33_9ACTN|nr:lytic transglycosylase domain-containing protein [Nocardioides caeni]THV16083.1 lytic transglycosylase domain-containing protein [Nocardioides caeni]
MGMSTRTTRSAWARWCRRTSLAVVVATALAIALAVTGLVSPPGFIDGSAPVSADGVNPRSTAPEAPEEPAPAVATEEDVARPVPVASVGRYGGGLLAVPAPAVAAYQRAATIINLTAECHLDWIVLAAIARVESDHGRGADGRHRIDRSGRVRPALVGAPLNGRGGRAAVSDTDGGKLDRRKRWDASVGPFALLPTTWSSVAVDGDGDGVRNPQDFDDAALATAVLLCASGRDLSRPRVLAKVLRDLHPARGYARTVLALAARYAEEMASAPTLLGGPATVTQLSGIGSVAATTAVDEMCRCADAVRALLGHDTGPAPTDGPAPSGAAGVRPGDGAGPGGGGGGAGDGTAGDPSRDVDPVAAPEPQPEPEPEREPESPPVDVPADPEPVEPEPCTEPEPTAEAGPADGTCGGSSGGGGDVPPDDGATPASAAVEEALPAADPSA